MPKKFLKIIIITSACLASATALFVAFVLLGIYLSQFHMDEFMPAPSYDGKYNLHTQTSTQKGVVMISFYITENQNNVFVSADKFRSYDLKAVEWKQSSYDVVVKSGDIGTVVCPYKNGLWVKCE